MSSEVQAAFASLAVFMARTRATFGILTDEVTSIIVDCRYTEDFDRPALVFTQTIAEFELRILIAACLYNAAQEWHMVRISAFPPLQWVLGALNDPVALEQSAETLSIEHRRWFADFDLYTMQRVPELWQRFCMWREDAQTAAQGHPLLAGATVCFEPHGFSRRCGLLRSPYPQYPIPSETTDIIKGGRPRRNRNKTLDSLLTTRDKLTITVLEVKRQGPEQFSQVFFGRLDGCEEIFCIKLYDERLFPIPDIDDMGS